MLATAAHIAASRVQAPTATRPAKRIALASRASARAHRRSR
jgi:hypothetical protein